MKTLRRWLSSLHVNRWNRAHPVPMALVEHVHSWDYCRNYGFLRYRICMSCGQKRAC